MSDTVCVHSHWKLEARYLRLVTGKVEQILRNPPNIGRRQRPECHSRLMINHGRNGILIDGTKLTIFCLNTLEVLIALSTYQRIKKSLIYNFPLFTGGSLCY